MSDETSHKGHKAVLIFLFALCAYSTLPVFGVGFYRNGSGQLFFQLWYLIGFMIIAFFLMHELITPLPPRDTSGVGHRRARQRARGLLP